MVHGSQCTEEQVYHVVQSACKGSGAGVVVPGVLGEGLYVRAEGTCARAIVNICRAKGGGAGAVVLGVLCEGLYVKAEGTSARPIVHLCRAKGSGAGAVE